MAAPTVSTVIPDQVATLASSFVLDISGNITDADAGDSLTYTVSGLPVDTGLSIDSGTGVLSGTPNQKDVDASPITAIITATDESDNSSNLTQIINVASGAPPAAAEFWIDPVSGLDTDPGTLALPWKTNSKGNQVVKDSVGDTKVYHKVGNAARSDPIEPQNAGDSTHEIIHTTYGGAGTHDVLGPSSGDMDRGYALEQPFTRIERNTSEGGAIRVNGEWQDTIDGPGQADGHIRSIGLLSADDITAEIDVIGTNGWGGISISGDRVILRPNIELHGTIDDAQTPNPQDQGNAIDIHASVPITSEVLIEGDGGVTSGDLRYGGHNLFEIKGATGTARGLWLRQLWDALQGFSVPDGNRVFGGIDREASLWDVYDMIFEGSGVPGDAGNVAHSKFNGTANSLLRCLHINSQDRFLSMTANGNTRAARRNRVHHQTLYNADGPAYRLITNQSGNPPNFAVTDLKFYNWVVRNFSLDPKGGEDDVIIRIRWDPAINDGDDWDDQIVFDNWLIWDDTLDTTTKIMVDINSSGGGLGKDTLAAYISAFPSNFVNFTVADPLLVNPANALASYADGETRYALDSGSPGIDAGTALTTANGAGSGSKTLVLVDARWVIDPRSWPMPLVGPEFGQAKHRVHLGGVGNVQYESVVKNDNGTGTITLTANQTWSDGAKVNLPHSNGVNADPDLGWRP